MPVAYDLLLVDQLDRKTAVINTGKNTRSYWQCLQAVFQIMQGTRVADIAQDLSQAEAWELASKCAREHRCLPGLAAGLQQEPAALAGIPREVRDSLSDAHRHNVERNLGIYAQAIRLTETLNSGDIRPIFLKGTAILLADPGQDIGRREQIDIDLVVPPDQLLAACELMQDAGYRFAPVSSDGTLDLTAAGVDTTDALRMSQYHHHLIPLVHPERSVAIELHRYPVSAEFNQNALLEGLLAGAQEHSAHDAKFRIPSVEDQIIHLLLGNFVHDGHAAAYRFPLRTADDYLRLISRNEDLGVTIGWEKIRGTCGSHLGRFNSLITLASSSSNAPRASKSAKTLTSYLIEKRYSGHRLAEALDHWARIRYLSRIILANPGKVLQKLHPR